MASADLDAAALTALIGIALYLGWLAHKRSLSQQPIHGGPLANLFNIVSAACLAAILPTVLMMVIVWHPEHVQALGIIWHPLVLAVLLLGAGSLLFACLHALCEREPLARAQRQAALQASRGWTEEDAKSSGL